MGLLVLAPIKPVVGDHEYVKPSSDATPIDLPLVKKLQVLVKSSPALAVTGAAAVTVSGLVDVQFKASVIVTV